jgi:hypothetical protein
MAGCGLRPHRSMQENSRGPRFRQLFGWWYVCIGAGFLLLTLHRWMMGERLWLVVLRAVIGAGFLFLGYLELSSRLRRR